MKKKKILLTDKKYRSIIHSNNWIIVELDLVTIKLIPRVVRPNDILGGFVSGCLEHPRSLNDHAAVAGIDILVHEPSPDLSRGEGHVNAYHYIIRVTGREDYPYVLEGPFRDQTLIGHWPTSIEFEVYYE